MLWLLNRSQFNSLVYPAEDVNIVVAAIPRFVCLYINFDPVEIFIHWYTVVYHIPNGLVAMISA
jgi:hypothetical protein